MLPQTQHPLQQSVLLRPEDLPRPTNKHYIRNILASSTIQIIIHIPSVPSKGDNVALDVQKASKEVGAPDLRREQVAKAAR